MSNKNPDRRSEQRYNYNSSCTVIVNSVRYNAELLDISYHGLALSIRDPVMYYTLNSVITFTIRKENYHEITLTAVIKNISEMDENKYVRYGLMILDGDMNKWNILVRTLE